MSEKSSAQEGHHDDSSHSSYSNRQHNLSQPKNMANMHQQPQPQEMPRLRPEEYWGNQNFQFQSPGFGPFQIPQSIAQIQNMGHFQLNKGDNLFEEYVDMGIHQDRRSNIRKVSGPFDNMMIPQEMNPMDDDPLQNGQPHQMIKPPTDRGQYMQGRFPQFQMPQVFKNPTGPIPNPYQNMGMMNPMMQVFPPQQFKQYQQYPHPYFGYMPYGIPMQREPETSHFNTISTVSKELQTKVYMISQQTTVSTFQCNCKKSKCLKLYCECFANGQVCSQNCNCMDCKNRIDNMQERQKAIEEALIRNNDAFNNILNGKQQIFPPNQQPHSPISIDPQSQFNQKTTYPIIQSTKDEKSQQNKNQNQANRARKGCNCKKSNCKKKYCECYSAQLACTEQCKCEGCYNHKIGGNNEDEKPPGQHINNNIIINQQQNIIQIGQGSQIKMEDSNKKTKFEEPEQQNQQEQSAESNDESESPKNENDYQNDNGKEKSSKKLLKKSKKIKKEVQNEDNPSIRVLQVSYQSTV